MPSRADRPPTPAELAARCVVADATVSGTFRFDGSFHLGYGGSRPYVAAGQTGDARFVAASGDRIRVEDDAGLLRVSDGLRTVVRDRESGALVEPERVVVGIGPERLLRPSLPELSALEPTVWEGRAAWLASCRVDQSYLIDDLTSVVGRWQHPEGWMELVDPRFNEPVEDRVFEVPDASAWQPPPDPHDPPRDPVPWDGRPRPTVTWTPTGLMHVPMDGDPETGWLVQQLRWVVPDGAVFLRLHRRPFGVDAPLPGDCHSWSADGCDWAIEVGHADGGVTPPTGRELAVMAASVDTATPWPNRGAQ